MNSPILPCKGIISLGSGFPIPGRATHISPANTCFGLEECFADLFSKSSKAMSASLMMTSLWPRTLTELRGPRRKGQLARNIKNDVSAAHGRLQDRP
jgi:hypothetical protein